MANWLKLYSCCFVVLFTSIAESQVCSPGNECSTEGSGAFITDIAPSSTLVSSIQSTTNAKLEPYTTLESLTILPTNIAIQTILSLSTTTVTSVIFTTITATFLSTTITSTTVFSTIVTPTTVTSTTVTSTTVTPTTISSALFTSATPLVCASEGVLQTSTIALIVYAVCATLIILLLVLIVIIMCFRNRTRTSAAVTLVSHNTVEHDERRAHNESIDELEMMQNDAYQAVIRQSAEETETYELI